MSFNAFNDHVKSSEDFYWDAQFSEFSQEIQIYVFRIYVKCLQLEERNLLPEIDVLFVLYILRSYPVNY